MKHTPVFYNYLKRAKVKPVAGVPDFALPFIPWKHQADHLNNMLLNDMFGEFSDCATGKTFTMQAYTILRKSEGYKTMVVMPPALLEQFKESLEHNFKGVMDYLYLHTLKRIKAVKGLAAQRQHDIQVEQWRGEGFPDVLLMSYQMFVRDFVQDDIVQHYQIFIADEAHNLRNTGSKAHRYFHELTEEHRDSALILATATPMYRDPSDAYGLIRLINRGAYSSVGNFNMLHVMTKTRYVSLARPVHGRKLQKITEVTGFKRMDALKQKLYKNAVRITKDKVLPKSRPTVIEVPVELSEAHLRYYRQFARARIAELPDGEIIAALNAQALRQELLRIITNAHEYSRSLTAKGNNVLQAIDTLMDSMEFSKDNKIVLFANSRTSVKMLSEYYADHNPALMYGDSDSGKGLKQFLHDETCTLMVGNPQSMGAGLNLQSVCSTFIFVEPVTIPGLMKQASERFPRAGQKNPVVGYVLKPLYTLASTMTDTMMEREGYIFEAAPDMDSFLLDIEGR